MWIQWIKFVFYGKIPLLYICVKLLHFPLFPSIFPFWILYHLLNLCHLFNGEENLSIFGEIMRFSCVVQFTRVRGGGLVVWAKRKMTTFLKCKKNTKKHWDSGVPFSPATVSIYPHGYIKTYRIRKSTPHGIAVQGIFWPRWENSFYLDLHIWMLLHWCTYKRKPKNKNPVICWGSLQKRVKLVLLIKANVPVVVSRGLFRIDDTGRERLFRSHSSARFCFELSGKFELTVYFKHGILGKLF